MNYISDLDLQRARYQEQMRAKLVAGILTMCGISVMTFCLLLLK